jgi:hypothetical protein
MQRPKNTWNNYTNKYAKTQKHLKRKLIFWALGNVIFLLHIKYIKQQPYPNHLSSNISIS